MNRTRWSDRYFVTVMLIVLGLLFVTFADFATLPTRSYILDAHKARAQLGCKGLESAIEAYIENEANKKHEPPSTLDDLVNPPFGGPSFLRNGKQDLIDPWGKPYQMERVSRPATSVFFLITTTAPDGTPISQFGAGPNATPKPLD